MKDTLQILQEIQSLGPMRLQKAWGLDHALVFELYAVAYKRIYLVCDYSPHNFSFHLQREKPEGLKITTPIILVSRKYLVGEILKFEILQEPKRGLRAQVFAHKHELKLIFDLETRPQIALFHNSHILAQSGKIFDPNLASTRESEITEIKSHDLSANITQAEIYNKNREKIILKDRNFIQQQEFSRKLKKLHALKNNLMKDLNKFEKILEHEHDAELLRINLHRIKKGQRELLIIDYTCVLPQEKIIVLDPRLSPKEFLEIRFNQIKKARRGIGNVRPRIALVDTEITELIKIGPSHNPKAADLPVKTPAKTQKRLPYKIFISSDNIPLWVGKSARDNDDLILHHARGKEWWFHVQQGTGSHVVVKNSNDVLLAHTMLEAAMLAAHFSSQKLNTQSEVIYTRVKNIKKPKGFAPGKILVEGEKSFMLRLDSKVLNKVLASAQITGP
jgi:predicted ribosome quality control (RQC) complex YloA/Tae2 family protein